MHERARARCERRSEKLGARLEELRGRAHGAAARRKVALRGAARGGARARGRGARSERARTIPDEAELEDALGAEFDYLDALRSVAAQLRAPARCGELGDRAQAAIDAFTALPDSASEDGIRGRRRPRRGPRAGRLTAQAQ